MGTLQHSMVLQLLLPTIEVAGGDAGAVGGHRQDKWVEVGALQGFR